MNSSLISVSYMAKTKAKKESKSKKPKKAAAKTKKSTKSKSKPKKSSKEESDIGMDIVVIEDNLEENKDKELEERKAYLEEARSQEAFD